MNLKKMISLTYKGHVLFKIHQKTTLRKGQTIRAYLGPASIRTATRSISHLPPRMVEWPIHDGTVGAWTTVRG